MLDTQLKKLLKEKFGYEGFRPMQAEIVERVLAGRDCIVLIPTGGGKSLCYQLPALALPGLTVVVSPLIALMKDQVDGLRENGIAAAYINSSLASKAIIEAMALAESGGLKILYLAPERLSLPEFQEFLRKLSVSLFAIDEAHCISEWGHDFRPDYRNLNFLRRSFPKVPIIALTATATPRVRQDIARNLLLPDAQIFVASFNRPNLKYSVISRQGMRQQILQLLNSYRSEPVIIYCFSRDDTEALAEYLNEQGFAAAAYHAGMTPKERSLAQENFIRDKTPIICATIAFGMGIDKPDVRLVVHASLPKSVEGYYQETGRAGRDGLLAECVLLFSRADARKLQRFIDEMEDDEARRHALLKLDQMLSYGEQAVCRRKYLLEYFGENVSAENCGNCDNCQSPRESFDATEITQKVLSAVLRTGQTFGAGHIIKVLRGEADRRVTARGHDRLSVFKIAAEISAAALKFYIRQLLHHGLLKLSGEEYPVLRLTEAGREFLVKRQSLRLPRYHASRPAGRKTADLNGDYDAELFEELRQLRRRIAASRGVPPYVIFGNAALREMCIEYPRSEEEFSKIPGVGREKLAAYGPAFVLTIKTYLTNRSKNPAV